MGCLEDDEASSLTVKRQFKACKMFKMCSMPRKATSKTTRKSK
jgi:hypothetical protein